MCLLDMDIFNEHLVLFLNRDGTSAICSIDIPFPSNCKVYFLHHLNGLIYDKPNGASYKYGVMQQLDEF